MTTAEKQQNLFDYLLDREIDRTGVLYTLYDMIDIFGFTRYELIDMGFETIDIDHAIELLK